jgi:DNA-directed RNA polymerase specialized sigma subunit
MKGLKEEIADIGAELEQYRDMQTMEFDYNQVDFDPDPYKDKGDMIPSSGSHYNDRSQVDSLVIHRVTFIERQEKRLFKLMTINSTINGILRYLKPLEKDIIQLRYMEGYSWNQVAKRAHFDYDYVREIDSRIIKSMINRYAETVLMKKPTNHPQITHNTSKNM